MFFIGIAGSIIPYLLLLGVMLAFSLGAGDEVLAQDEVGQDEKSIYISIEKNESENITESFQYNQFLDIKDLQANNEVIPPLKTHLKIPYQSCINNPFGCFSQLYSLEFNALYFGLSPPCSIS